MNTQQGTALLEGARAGDSHAQHELVGEWLPLVYNIVGMALNGHAERAGGEGEGGFTGSLSAGMMRSR